MAETVMDSHKGSRPLVRLPIGYQITSARSVVTLTMMAETLKKFRGLMGM